MRINGQKVLNSGNVDDDSRPVDGAVDLHFGLRDFVIINFIKSIILSHDTLQSELHLVTIFILLVVQSSFGSFVLTPETINITKWLRLIDIALVYLIIVVTCFSPWLITPSSVPCWLPMGKIFEQFVVFLIAVIDIICVVEWRAHDTFENLKFPVIPRLSFGWVLFWLLIFKNIKLHFPLVTQLLVQVFITLIDLQREHT